MRLHLRISISTDLGWTRALLVLGATLGCRPEADPPRGTWEEHPGATEPVVDPSVPGEPGPDLRAEVEAPGPLDLRAERVDVLVIGSGAAGMAAGISAREAGAEVLILERDAEPGEGITYATRGFAVGTSYQEAAGIVDSPSLAATEWESITGVPGDEPAVTAFLEGSADTLDWLVERGYAYNGLALDPDSGSVARMHQVVGEDTRDALVANFDGELRLNTEANELILRDGRVVGVRWTDRSTGETGLTKAGAVVVATGGFLRDRARVDEADPSLVDRRLVYETGPLSDGGGVGLLSAAGVAFEATEHIGIYLHAVQDPERDPGEALVLSAMDKAIFVDEAGARFASESGSRSFDFFDLAPGGEIFAVVPDEIGATLAAYRPPYNRADPETSESYSLPALAVLTDEVQVAATVDELALAAGIDADGLAATVDEVIALTVSDAIDAFGRDWGGGAAFEDDLWWSIHITPGLAKAFGGASADEQSRALDAEGAPIPGLYAAGEVAGMIPGGAAGEGFSGTIMACYHFGRVAGANAAAYAAELR